MKKSFSLLFFYLASYFLLSQGSTRDPFNSVYDERDPIISPDGKTIYFTIAHHPENTDGRRDPGDIWYSVFENGSWSSPVHAGENLNDYGYNGIAGFSSDGKQLFLLSHYTQGQRRAKSQGIAVSKWEGTHWGFPNNITIPYFYNKTHTSGHISADLKHFVFSAESHGTYGVEDLYISHKTESGHWSPPRNLGKRINTSFQELCPSFSPDGNTLYFSSNGRKGQGSFDIYYATRLDSTWQQWSEPKSVVELNTPGRELFFKMMPHDGLVLFTSTVNSNGYGDIRFHSPDTNYQAPVLVKDIFDKVDTMAAPVSVGPHDVKLYGQVINSKTQAPLQAKVSVRGDYSSSVVSTAGTYQMVVAKENLHKICVEAHGFISQIEDIDTAQLKGGQELQLDFVLQPAEKGLVVNLKSVLFEQSTTTLLKNSYSELDLVVDFLKENPSIFIELAGHTDNRGIHRDNVKLSRARVEKVKAYLVAGGVAESRIDGTGHGGLKPIADNNNEETRRLNRRVEFIIKKM